MTIDRALRQLHVALYDHFAMLSSSEQSTIIIALEDLVDKLARGIEPPYPKERAPCQKNTSHPEQH